MRERLSCDEAVPFVFTFALSHAHVGSALAALLGAEASCSDSSFNAHMLLCEAYTLHMCIKV